MNNRTNQIGSVAAISIPVGDYARVDTGGVRLIYLFIFVGNQLICSVKEEIVFTMPEVDVNVRNRLASVDINELDVDINIDTLLVFTDVPSHVFRVNV